MTVIGVSGPAKPPAPSPPGAGPSGASRRRGARRREAGAGFAFLSPWLVGFVVLTAFPMVASLYLAFTDYDLFRPPSWVGWENFSKLFDDPRFWTSAKVTAIYVLVGTPIKLAAALLVAMVLNLKHRGQGAYRSIFYAPSLIGASVSIAIVWKAMFIDDGIVDRIQQLFGLPAGG